MEQHPIPRQITSFEFKLIGFMTLKQFLYLVIFAPMGYIVYFIFPIPFLNVLVGIATAAVGVALAFVPINDRPLDIWIKNAWKRLNSPTQYTYHKHNAPISLFNNLYFVSDPHVSLAHIESQQMLKAYLEKTQQTIKPNVQKKQLQQAFQAVQSGAGIPTTLVQGVQGGAQAQVQAIADMSKPISAPAPQVQPIPAVAQPAQPVMPQNQDHKPYFVGSIKNGKRIPLPGILIYVKDQSDKPVRLLKTNQHGIFATFNPLPPGDYTFEVKDPKNSYFFDTMKLAIQSASTNPIEFFSKELL
jgi:hypothetical protein